MKETLPISLSLTNFLYLFYLYIIFQPPGRVGQQHQSPSQLVGLSNLSRCRQGTSTLIQLSCCHPVSLCGFYIFLRHMYFFCPLKLQCCHLRPWTRLDCKWIRLSTQSTTQHSFQLALLALDLLRLVVPLVYLPFAFVGSTESPKKTPKRASLGENKLKNGLLRLNPLFWTC